MVYTRRLQLEAMPSKADVRKAEEQWYKTWVQYVWDGDQPKSFSVVDKIGSRREVIDRGELLKEFCHAPQLTPFGQD